MKKITNPLFVLFPFIVFSQSWQQYSDSVLVYFKKNDIEKTTQFINLADNELSKINIIKDTIYADYIYRKGVVKSSLDIKNSLLLKESNDILKQSLDIWQISSKKNYLKILKINYYLGCNYYLVAGNDQNKLEYLNSYKYFEQCHNIIRKHNYKSNPLYKRILYFMALIDYHIKKDLNNAKKIANEYIEFTKKQNFEDFNFDNVEIYNFNQDYINQEKLLLNYLDNYNIQKLNDTDLLFKIYLKLYLNKLEFKDQNGDFNFPKEIIKYGEEALKIGNLNKSKYQLEIDTIHLQLELAYRAIKDNINSEKYRKFNYDYYKSENNIDFYDELEKLYYDENYNEFKAKFDKYESEFKTNKDISSLLDIYKFSITLFEKNIIFKQEDIENQIAFLKDNKSNFLKESQISFDSLLAEFYTVTWQIESALKICNLYIKEPNLENRLYFYKCKSTCEKILGFKEDSLKSAIMMFNIASEIYGDNNPKLLPYLTIILSLDLKESKLNSTKISTKTLKILYDNKLELTEVAINVWYGLGQIALNNKNLKDAKIYCEKAVNILESSKAISNPILYYVILLDLSNINILESNFDSALKYSNKVKLFLDSNPQIPKFGFADYYYQLGDIYFHQDKFIESKINYQKSFTIYGTSITNSRNLNYIICEYFINNDLQKTILSLEKFHNDNKEVSIVPKIIYLLKYNSGDFVSARNLLTSQLSTIISNNNQFFHLLSDTEKEILYKGFSDQFEFLNTYLLSNDKSFLSEYINFRFYSKSLLFSNSFKTEGINEKNKELFLELKSNTFQINKKLENKVSDTKTIEDLKNKNREIEKMLSANTKPLLVPTLKDLNTKLVSGEAYIEIVRINKQSRNATKKGIDIVKMFTDSISYGAIVIKKNSTPKFILIDGSNQLEKQYAFSFKTKIQSKQEDLESYNLLFEKIDNELKDVKKIYLVTDGIYNSINIESIYNPNKKQYLIDYLKVQQIQNVRVITEEKKEFKVGLNTKAILFGNPDFDLLITDNNTASFSFDRGLDNSAIDEIKSSVKIGRLNGTQKEIETLDAILKNTKSTVEIFSKSTALEDNLKNIQSPDILHIATHGYFLSNDDTSKTKQSIANLINDNYKNDSYLKSGLLLAGAQNTLNGNQPENSNNGILTAEEAKSLNLKDTELVVLSACETGLGNNLIGEGVIGLQRAFMIAGAKSVIMSLWSVSDEKTQELMTLFYTNWINNNMTKEEALHQAKLEMKKLYPQPYYWAGFVLLE
jgi:CHAT domain-containing protein